MPRKVTVKILGMPRIGVGDAEIKIDDKGQKFQFYLEYPLSLESEIRPIKCQNMSSLY